MRPARVGARWDAMEHVRLNLLTADPGLFDKLTTHLEHEVGPRLEEEAGSRHDGSRDSGGGADVSPNVCP